MPECPDAAPLTPETVSVDTARRLADYLWRCGLRTKAAIVTALADALASRDAELARFRAEAFRLNRADDPQWKAYRAGYLAASPAPTEIAYAEAESRASAYVDARRAAVRSPEEDHTDG